jgi:electron transport complex protein RnfA
MSIIGLAISACLISNVLLSQFLGICSFLGVSNKTDASVGMSGAVIFVLTLSSLVCGVLYNFILVPLGIEYLKTIVFILIVAALVQFVEMFLKRFVPALYKSLGIYLPLITTNCAVLGVAVTNAQQGYGIFTGTVNGFFTAIGYSIAIIILSYIRGKTDTNPVLPSFKGFPMVMISAALMSIAFSGFGALSI